MKHFLILAFIMILSSCNILSDKQYSSEIQGKKVGNDVNAIYDLRIPDAKVEGFVNALKSYSSLNDSIHLSKMIQYPLHVDLTNQHIVIKDANEFIEYYHSIFTDNLKSAIYSTDYTELKVNENGFVIGNNQLIIGWIKDNHLDNNLYITKINNTISHF